MRQGETRRRRNYVGGRGIALETQTRVIANPNVKDIDKMLNQVWTEELTNVANCHEEHAELVGS